MDSDEVIGGVSGRWCAMGALKVGGVSLWLGVVIEVGVRDAPASVVKCARHDSCG
jgi:hypothetical protein